MKFLLTSVFLLCLVSAGSLSFAGSNRGVLIEKIIPRMVGMSDTVFDLSPEALNKLWPKLKRYFSYTNETNVNANALLGLLLMKAGRVGIARVGEENLHRTDLFEYVLKIFLENMPLAELEAIESEELLIAEKALDELLGSGD